MQLPRCACYSLREVPRWGLDPRDPLGPFTSRLRMGAVGAAGGPVAGRKGQGTYGFVGAVKRSY